MSAMYFWEHQPRNVVMNQIMLHKVFFFHLITFLLEKSSMRNNSPIRSLFHRHSKVNLICGGYKEKRIYFCISCRLLPLSIPRLDFYFFSGGRYNIQYFSLVHSRLQTSGCSNISFSGIPLCFIETLLTFAHHLI